MITALYHIQCFSHKHKTNPHPWLVPVESGAVWPPLGTQARERAVGEGRKKKE